MTDYTLTNSPDVVQLLTRIADALEHLASNGKPAEPNYQIPIQQYAKFDWSVINATVLGQDPDGPTHVGWGGAIWTRRSPENKKYEPVIFYSRPLVS